MTKLIGASSKCSQITWRKWIRCCLHSTNYSILINGRPRGKIVVNKGLR